MRTPSYAIALFIAVTIGLIIAATFFFGLGMLEWTVIGAIALILFGRRSFQIIRWLVQGLMGGHSDQTTA
jgi:hypothetical protein